MTSSRFPDSWFRVLLWVLFRFHGCTLFSSFLSFPSFLFSLLPSFLSSLVGKSGTLWSFGPEPGFFSQSLSLCCHRPSAWVYIVKYNRLQTNKNIESIEKQNIRRRYSGKQGQAVESLLQGVDGKGQMKLGNGMMGYRQRKQLTIL